MTNDCTCGYDGFKLFIPGKRIIKFLIDNSKQFHLFGKYSVHDERRYELPLTGYYEQEENGYRLSVSATNIVGLGQGVEIKGSFHKFYTNGENYSTYYWWQFIETVERLQAIFPFATELAFVLNQEIGLNIPVPLSWNITAKEILRNFLTYKGGSFIKAHQTNHKEDGFYRQYDLTEYLLKAYDKAMQNGLVEQRILRYEMKVLKSAYLKRLGIVTLEDLMDFDNHQKLCYKLSDTFNDMVIYQDEVDDLLLLPDTNVHARQYNREQAWEVLHDECRHKYKYTKLKLEELIEENCPYNYKKELQANMTRLIEENVMQDELVF
jgi:hypothetical protein